MNKINKLYKLQKSDIKKSGTIFTDAFMDDPIWKKLFEGYSLDERRLFFQGPVRYCLSYGEAYATTDQLEGIMAFLPSQYADMTFLRNLKAGFMLSYMSKAGFKLMKLMRIMDEVFAPLEAARKESMDNRDYLYLLIVGVQRDHQGQGIGKKLLTELIGRSEALALPIYLETATDKNIKMYEKLGFKVIKKVNHPVINLPQWTMIRETSS